MTENPNYVYPTKKDEFASVITHFIATIFAISAFILLVVRAVYSGNLINIFACTVFGLSLISMYLASTIYHYATNPKIKTLLQKVDHMNIFFLIAGTYTPVVLIGLNNAVGWTIFGLLWFLFTVGIIYKVLAFSSSWLSTALYLAMGWIAIGFIVQLITHLPTGCLMWLVLGGMAYTSGVVFYMLDQSIEYCHGIWHIFVFLGSFCHFISIYIYLAGA